MSQKFLTQPNRFPTVGKESFRRLLEYCAGQLSAADLINAMRSNRLDLSNAHMCIAVTVLAEGDREKAHEHLRRCVDAHVYEFYPYNFCQMLLSRMDHDPTWPPWIRPAK